MIPLEMAKTFEFPPEYATDNVCEGKDGLSETKVPTFYIDRIHMVMPSGRLACQCDLNPKTARAWFSVDAPVDFRHLLCPMSMDYLRRQAWNIINPTNT